MTGPMSYKVMLGDERIVRRHVDQIHAHHQRPERGNAKQQTVSTQSNKKDEAWLGAEEAVLSGDHLEEPAATEAVGSSRAVQTKLR